TRHCRRGRRYVPLTFYGRRPSCRHLEILWESMAAPTVEVLRGTLDLLILKAVSWGPTHGFGVARWIEQATNDVLQIEEGSLYPAPHSPEPRAWIAAEWGPSENNRRAMFYRPTPKGRAQLRAETATWTQFAHAFFAALEAPPTPA